MRLKPMILLALASGCGLVAMFLFQQATRGNTGGEVDDKIPVLVVKSEITPGSLLNEENVEFRDYPVSIVPENVVTDPEEFEERALRVRAFPGDFVTLDKLSGKGDHAPSQDIPSGMVAITIVVDSAMISSGLLLPGDRVDLLVTYTMRGQFGGGKVIKTVLEFVEVFSLDQRREIEAGKGEALAKTITLMVDPKEAMLVKLAEDTGKLHLTIRSKDDATPRVKEKDRFKPTDISEFMGIQDEGAEEEEVNGNENEDQTKDNDLEQFLEANSKPESEPETLPVKTPVAVEPQQENDPAEKNTWEIEIFSGDTRRIEEVAIPESELPVVEPDTETDQAPSSGNPLLDGIKQLFGGKGGADIQTTNSPEPAPVDSNDQENVETGQTPVLLPLAN